MTVKIIGAGLAGSEAAYQLAKRGIPVELHEMRPAKLTPAHKTGSFGELVCSNSLRSAALTNAIGLLKEELRHLDSLIMRAADATELPSGSSLAVDRTAFAEYITKELRQSPNIRVIDGEVTEIPEGLSLIATGPLTSEALLAAVERLTGQKGFYFYDAAAPIVTRESLDMNIIYRKSRYGYGEDDYLNCPLTRSQFNAFYRALIIAQTAELPLFEKPVYFEGCLPVEIMAKRGEQTLLFGPLKPVGLEKPDGLRPYAVVQLRQDNAADSLYNLVGFQTHLKFGEQDRVFRLIPGLEKAKIVRYGVMHRNTYICAPRFLSPTGESTLRPGLYFAGQFSGVEGYIESTASGMISGLNLARRVQGKPAIIFPESTMIGAMAYYITHANPLSFQPMNANWGIFHSTLPGPGHDRGEDARIALDQIDELAGELSHG